MRKHYYFIAIISIILLTFGDLSAQKYFTKTGELSFYSHTPLEDIEAISNTATTVYDSESGKIQWAVLIKSFEFEKALMQEHFNENYMESSKHPKATFSGQVKDHQSVNLGKDGTYKTDVVGELTIHGVSQPVTAEATFVVADGAVNASSSLTVAVADYDIEIPAVVRDNIAKQIEITINAAYAILDRS